MPGVTDELERSAKVRVRYRALDGSSARGGGGGTDGRLSPARIDQLDGIFWIDRLSKLKRDRLIKRFEKLQRIEVPDGGDAVEGVLTNVIEVYRIEIRSPRKRRAGA